MKIHRLEREYLFTHKFMKALGSKIYESFQTSIIIKQKIQFQNWAKDQKALY